MVQFEVNFGASINPRPMIALVLLAFLGGRMILEGVRMENRYDVCVMEVKRRTKRNHDSLCLVVTVGGGYP